MDPLLMLHDALIPLAAATATPELDRVMLFGFLAAFAAALCQFQAVRDERGRLPMAACAMALSVYGFLVGAWPLGLVEAAASIMQFGQWANHHRRRFSGSRRGFEVTDRFMQLFGPPEQRTRRSGDAAGWDGHEN